MTDNVRAVVIDTGSYSCKAGFAGDAAPRVTFPSTVPSDIQTTHTEQQIHPIERASRIDPVLLSDTINREKAAKEKITQIMFESFNTPLLHLGISSVLSLYAAGKTTGIVIESGHGTTCTVPIYEGHMLSDATNCINFGGQDLTTHLVTLLEKKGHSLTIHDHDIIHTEIKEKLCFVSANEQVLEKSRYELPDGYILKIGNEKFQCPEALFQPNGVHLLTYDSITKCDSDIRKEMYNSIVLAGGSTLFPGMKDRISLEMYYLAPAMKINVTISQHVVQHNQEVSCWVGGSMLGSLSLKPWITAKEYEEFGPSNVHRKCF